LKPRHLILAVLCGILLYLVWSSLGGHEPGNDEGGAAGGGIPLSEAFENRLSDLVLEIEGEIDRILSDDNEGSRHQRFILRTANGHSVLVAHNIDLAPRVPLHVGDAVRLRGEYEWNEKGGVVHWTHRDPRGSHPDGWIIHEGERYD
jgi:hypothetical protein